MALLTINGIEAAVAVDSARLGDRTLGGDIVADDGSLHRARSAYFDALNAVTPLLSPTDALAWRGLLEGRGHRIAFDADPDYAGTNPSAGFDPYTSRGLLLSGVASRRRGHAQFGAEISGSTYPNATAVVVDLGTDAYFDQAVAVEYGAENLFPERVRRGGDLGSGSSAAGFATSGAGTLALETTEVLEGANSIKFTPVTPATDYFEVAAAYRATPVDGTSHSLSFYMKASVAMNVIASARDNGPSTTTVTFAVTTTWRRFSIAHLPGSGSGAATSMWLRWVPQSAGTVYVDAIQAEGSSNAGIASSWVGAGSAATESRSSAGGLTASLTDVRRQDDITVMGWFLGPHWSLETDTYFPINATLWSLGTSAEGVHLRHNGSTGALELRIASSLAAEATATSYATGIGNKAWHHVAVVLRRAPTTGHYKAHLFVDGASVGTPSSTYAIPSWGTAPSFFVGRKFTGVVDGFFHGMVDELVVLPYALTADMIGDVYAARFSDLPLLNVAGDYFGETVEALGKVTGDGLRFSIAGDPTAGLQSRNAVIAFTLNQARR